MKKILVVDDNAEIRRLVRWTLELDDYQIKEAHDGIGGLALAESWVPDLILLDIMMPGAMNGLQVCESIRNKPELGATIVVLLSALGQMKDREKGMQAGANAYIVKPFSPALLTQAVNKLLQ